MKYTVESLSLVVPAYNEEEVIGQTIKTYRDKLKKLAKKFEIIIVDDGSIDKTNSILRSLEKKYDEIKIINHHTNLGVGRALLDGFKKAKYEWVMHNSADEPFNLNDLTKLKDAFKISDVIVAVREDRSANSPFRKLTSLTSRAIVKVFFGTNIEDFHFIQIYKTSILKKIKIISNDTFMPAELLVNLSHRNYTIFQFRAKFHKRMAGHSKYDNPIRYLVYLRELIKFWWRLNFS